MNTYLCFYAVSEVSEDKPNTEIRTTFVVADWASDCKELFLTVRTVIGEYNDELAIKTLD